jgi:hypothetical protein
MPMKIGHNPNRNIALGCCAIIAAGIALIALPSMIGIDGMNGGYAMIMFGIFIALVGIISVIVFLRMASLQDTLLKEGNILVHWTYPPDEWRRFVEKEHSEDAAARKSLFLLIAGITVIVGLILWFLSPDTHLVTIWIVLGIILVIGITAVLSTWAVYRWNKNHPGEIYIARDGAYFSGRLHVWKGLGTRLEKIDLEDSARSQRIVVNYSSPNYLTRNSYEVRIPVPPGQEEAARKVVSQIRAVYFPRSRQ